VQNQFLLLVALTPQEYLNPLRRRLQEVSLASLRRVKYDNFQALILGDEDREEGNLKFIKAPSGTKGLRLDFALKYIKKLGINYDYIARFDDDDVLNPSIFKLIAEIKADCIADNAHAFYDLNSNLTITSQKDWLANTVFLKKEHALALLPDNRTLIEQDHGEEWHLYFKKKEISYVKSASPIYIRVLSPTSITSTSNESGSYAQYLDSFGNWLLPVELPHFSESLKGLESIHLEFYPDGKYVPVRRSALSRIVGKLKRLF